MRSNYYRMGHLVCGTDIPRCTTLVGGGGTRGKERDEEEARVNTLAKGTRDLTRERERETLVLSLVHDSYAHVRPRNPPIEYYLRPLSIAAAAGTSKDIAMKARSPLCRVLRLYVLLPFWRLNAAAAALSRTSCRTRGGFFKDRSGKWKKGLGIFRGFSPSKNSKKNSEVKRVNCCETSMWLNFVTNNVYIYIFFIFM